MALRTKTWALWLWLFWLTGKASYVCAEALTYDALPNLVRQRSRVVKSAEATVEAANTRLGYLDRSFGPRFETVFGSEHFRMGTQRSLSEPYWRVDTFVNVYNGGKDSLEESLRAGLARVSAKNAEKEFMQELLEARKAYIEELSIDQLMEVEKNLLVLQEAHRRRAMLKYRAGLTSESDMLQFDLAKSKSEDEIKRLMGRSDVVKTQLALLTGIEDHREISLNETIKHPAEDDLKGAFVDVGKVPEIAVLKERSENLMIEASKVRNQWLPQVDLYASLVQFTSRDREIRPPRERQEWALGLRLKMDLGDRWEASREAQSKVFMAKASGLYMEQRSLQLLSYEHELRHELQLLHQLLHQVESRIVRAERILQLTLDEYDRGLKNGLDILQVSESLADLKRNSILLMKDYFFKRCDLLALLGN